MNTVDHANRVYLVSPDMELGDAARALLDLYAIPVHTFTDAESLLSAYTLNEAGRSCLLVDDSLPNVGALSLIQRLRSIGFTQPTILISDIADRDLRQRAQYCGATEVVEKALAKRFVIDHLKMLTSDTAVTPGAAAGAVKSSADERYTLRIMRPDDAHMVQAFVRGLSDESRYLRFFSGIDRLSPTMLDRFTHPDYPNNFALVATIFEAGQEYVIATARYEPTADRHAAEYAVVVADEWHGLGIANQLIRGLTAVAAVAGKEVLQGIVLRCNQQMLKLAHKLGFTLSIFDGDEALVRTSKYLREPKRPAAALPYTDNNSNAAMIG